MNPQWKQTLQVPFKKMTDYVTITCVSGAKNIIGTFDYTVSELTRNTQTAYKEWFHVKSNDSTTAHILLESEFKLVKVDLLTPPYVTGVS